MPASSPRCSRRAPRWKRPCRCSGARLSKASMAGIRSVSGCTSRSVFTRSQSSSALGACRASSSASRCWRWRRCACRERQRSAMRARQLRSRSATTLSMLGPSQAEAALTSGGSRRRAASSSTRAPIADRRSFKAGCVFIWSVSRWLATSRNRARCCGSRSLRSDCSQNALRLPGGSASRMIRRSIEGQNVASANCEVMLVRISALAALCRPAISTAVWSATYSFCRASTNVYALKYGAYQRNSRAIRRDPQSVHFPDSSCSRAQAARKR